MNITYDIVTLQRLQMIGLGEDFKTEIISSYYYINLIINFTRFGRHNSICWHRFTHWEISSVVVQVATWL